MTTARALLTMATRLATVSQWTLWVPTVYLSAVTVAGALPRPQDLRVTGEHRFVVLIPAHNEVSMVGVAISSVLASDSRTCRRRCLVIADNCTDETAEVARVAGAEVWERHDDVNRGKGAALAWALRRLLDEPTWDACTILDADGQVQPSFFDVVSGRLADGARVVQAERYVANVTESRVSQMAAIGMAANGVLRLRGRSRFGAASKLLGTGMTFSRDVLAEHPWTAAGLVEDAEYGFGLLRAGVRPVYEPGCRLLDVMPTTRLAAGVQRTRWERGRVQLRRAVLVPAMAEGLRRRDGVLLEALISELVFPPLAMSTSLVGIAAIARFALCRRGFRSGLVQLAVPIVHVVTALAVVKAPLVVWRSLAVAPIAVGWKVAVSLRASGRGRGRSEVWERTPRA